jgi:iron complex transport system substrate-binding protein
MGFERIVSLLPSATELLYELGEEGKIYGVTHECLYPKSAKSKPRIMRRLALYLNKEKKYSF